MDLKTISETEGPRPALASTSFRRTPRHTAVEIRSPPTSLEMQVRVWAISTTSKLLCSWVKLNT